MQILDDIANLFKEFFVEMDRYPKLCELVQLLFFALRKQSFSSDIAYISITVNDDVVKIDQDDFNSTPDLYELNDNIFTLVNDLVIDVWSSLESDMVDTEKTNLLLGIIFKGLQNANGLDYFDHSKNNITKIDTGFRDE